MNIAVVGAGIAGLTAALAFARRGHEVKVYEAASQLNAVGAGIQLGNNALWVLDQLGIREQVLALATQPESGLLLDGGSGERICTLPFARYARGRYGGTHATIHRGCLQQVLLRAVREQGVPVELGWSAESVTQNRQEIRFSTSNGISDHAELLVVADGVHSRLRNVLSMGACKRFCQAVAWRGSVAVGELSAEQESGMAVWTMPGQHLVQYPVLSPDTQQLMLNIVALRNVAGTVSERSQNWANGIKEHAFPPFDFASACDALQQLAPRLDTTQSWPLYAVDMPDRWWKGRAVLVGDAAHAMLPSMAQGAVMAMEDAWELAAQIGSPVAQTDEQLAVSLWQYQRARAPRVKKIQAASAANLAFFHRAAGIRRSMSMGVLRSCGKFSEPLIGRRVDWIYNYRRQTKVSR